MPHSPEIYRRLHRVADVSVDRAFAEGWGARLSDAVESVLARRPRSLGAYLEDTLRDGNPGATG